MTEKAVPNEILIITGAATADRDLEPRRGSAISSLTSKIISTQSVDITSLREQVNVFLQQMTIVMNETPEKVGGFQLAEFEVSAGITVEGKGEVKLALLGGAELSGGMNAGLKFLFKRS